MAWDQVIWILPRMMNCQALSSRWQTTCFACSVPNMWIRRLLLQISTLQWQIQGWRSRLSNTSSAHIHLTTTFVRVRMPLSGGKNSMLVTQMMHNWWWYMFAYSVADTSDKVSSDWLLLCSQLFLTLWLMNKQHPHLCGSIHICTTAKRLRCWLGLCLLENGICTSHRYVVYIYWAMQTR